MNGKDYIELRIQINPFTEDLAERIMAEFAEHSYDMFETEGDCLKAYIEKDKYDPSLVRLLSCPFRDSVKITKTLIPAENWNKEWEDNFKGFTLPPFLSICTPESKPEKACRFNIYLKPGQAFGTGDHPTTFMMLTLMYKHAGAFRDKTVLDMGSGSGILSIFAAKLRAASIYAIDIEPIASRSTYANVCLNRVLRRVHIANGDASLLQASKYDIILANIHKNVIIMDMPTYAMAAAPSAMIFLSGFFKDDMQDVLDAAEKNSLQYVSHMEQDSWVALVLIKK